MTRIVYLRAYSELGRWADVDRVIAEIRAGDTSATERVALALLRGDRQAAITALEQGLTPQGGLIFDVPSPGCDPLLHPLHDEPRYQALMARLGMRICPVRVLRPFRMRPIGANGHTK